jgi:hypothetical protein
VEAVPAEPKRKPPWLPLLLGGLAALALFVLCLGAAALAVRRATQFARGLSQTVDQAMQAFQPSAAALQFQGNLSAGNTQAAYGLTSAEFQKRWTLQDFAGLVNDHPELAGPWADFAPEEQTETSLTVRLTAEAKGGRKVPVKLRLRKEEGQWKVDEITWP